jgi:hypothetical protein
MMIQQLIETISYNQSKGKSTALTQGILDAKPPPTDITGQYTVPTIILTRVLNELLFLGN